MSLHLNLQCQRADKNTDTRITLSSEKAWSIWFFATVAVAGEAVRCGDTPLGPPPRPVKHYFTVFGRFLEKQGGGTQRRQTAPLPTSLWKNAVFADAVELTVEIDTPLPARTNERSATFDRVRT